MRNYLNYLYDAGRWFVFTQIYPAPTIFNPHTRNFIGVREYIHFLPHYQKTCFPLEIDFAGKIRLTKDLHSLPPDTFEGILIADLNANKCIYNPQAQYIIFVGGNTTCFQILIPEMLGIFDAHHKEPYIISFNPPGVGMSPGITKNIEDYCKALQVIVDTLIANGIPADNIVIIGHSLGAAIAARIIAEYQSQGRDVKLFVDRPMGSIGDAASAQFKNILPTRFLRAIFGTFLAWLVKRIVKFFAQDLDVAKDFTLINQTNRGSARGMVTELDQMMEHCCIADSLPPSQMMYLRRFTVAAEDRYRRAHSKVRHELIAEDSHQTADHYLHECITAFKPKVKLQIS